MRVCVSSMGKGIVDKSDPRFGRCAYFAILDTETNHFIAIENVGGQSAQGAGIAAAQRVIDEKVDGVITGNVGPNAMKLLNAGDIKIYQSQGLSILEEISFLKEGKLSMIQMSRPAHYGMGEQHRKG